MDGDELAASFMTYEGRESINITDAVLRLAVAVRDAAQTDATCPETGTFITITESIYMVAKEIGRVADALQALADAHARPS